jgi:hypothetical protein
MLLVLHKKNFNKTFSLYLSLELLHRTMPFNSDQREQFYLEASLLKLKNIYSKWQVKPERE